MKPAVFLFLSFCSVVSIICYIITDISSLAPYIYYLVVRNGSVNIIDSRIKDNFYFSMDQNNKTSVALVNNKYTGRFDHDFNNISTTVLKSRYTRTKLQVDLNFAKNLRQAQPNIEVPLVNDIVVSKHNNSWLVYVIINNGNTHHESFICYQSVNVTLEVNNEIYYNELPECRIKNIRVLKYVVPKMKPFGKLTLFDHTKRIIYKDLPYNSLVKQPKRKVAVCAYISNFNSAAEIKSLLAFYILQKIDNVIFYCSVHCDYFQNLLKKEIDFGYVILYEFPWPLTRRYGSVHRSVQGSQINSCYYRHRDYFEYIISQDVDEYFYSELYPYNLYKAITKAFELSPGKLSLPV